MLTLIAVIAIILGAMAVLVGGGGVVNMILSEQIQGRLVSSLEAAVEANPEQKDLEFQLDIQKAAQEATQKYWVVNFAVAIGSLLVGIGLLTGAILVLRNSPTGRRILVAACLITVIVDLGKSTAQFIVQRDMMDVMSEKMPGAITANPNMPPEQKESMEGIFANVFRVVKVVTLVFMVGWFLLKAAFYLFSASYLSRQEIKTLFEPPPMADVVT